MNWFWRSIHWLKEKERAANLADYLIVLLTAVIAFWAGMTWDEMHKSGTDTHDLAVAAKSQSDAGKTQAEKMTNLSELAKAVAKLTYKAPLVRPSNWMGSYHSGKEEKVWVRVRVQNDGKSEALALSIAVNLDFLPSGSRPTVYPSDFNPMTPSSTSGFNPLTPNTLAPFIHMKKDVHAWECTICADYTKYMNKQIPYKDLTFYIWGEIRYRDFTGDQTTMQFCRFTSGKNVLEATEGDAGYAGPYTDCP